MNVQTFQTVYKDSSILDTKINVHNLFTTISTDIPLTIVKNSNILTATSVLDVGCGTGGFLSYLRTQGSVGKLAGVDITTGVFATEAEKKDIAFHVASATNLPFKDGSFEAVTALHMLSHTPNLDKTFEEIQRILQPNGYFVATTNSLYSYQHVAKYRKRVYEIFNWGEPVYTTSSFNLENMESVLRKCWYVEMITLEGELKIPLEPFISYFDANIDIWENEICTEKRIQILNFVNEWAKEDLVNSVIVEPKYIGIAFCKILNNDQ